MNKMNTVERLKKMNSKRTFLSHSSNDMLQEYEKVAASMTYADPTVLAAAIKDYNSAATGMATALTQYNPGEVIGALALILISFGEAAYNLGRKDASDGF
jgi:hypothetical protein